jgi:hypothetical protein
VKVQFDIDKYYDVLDAELKKWAAMGVDSIAMNKAYGLRFAMHHAMMMDPRGEAESD